MAEKVRIGVIGAGWWATAVYIPRLARRPDVELAAVTRRSPAELEQVREKFGYKFATTDFRELVEQPLDGVVVTSPHSLHFEHAKAALEHGLHVMVDKPFTLRASEAWDHTLCNVRTPSTVTKKLSLLAGSRAPETSTSLKSHAG